MASSILKVGEDRVWFNPEDLESISSAVTKEDIRKLIKEGAIQAKPVKGTGRYRARIRRLQRAKGRRRGAGKRKGSKKARYPKKERWMSSIRALRAMLAQLRNEKKIDVSTYRKLYLMAKGGVFKSKAHLESYIKEKGLLKKVK
jgi:large subunit ribosomal protein L19e